MYKELEKCSTSKLSEPSHAPSVPSAKPTRELAPLTTTISDADREIWNARGVAYSTAQLARGMNPRAILASLNAARSLSIGDLDSAMEVFVDPDRDARRCECREYF